MSFVFLFFVAATNDAVKFVKSNWLALLLSSYILLIGIAFGVALR